MCDLNVDLYQTKSFVRHGSCKDGGEKIQRAQCLTPKKHKTKLKPTEFDFFLKVSTTCQSNRFSSGWLMGSYGFY